MDLDRDFPDFVRAHQDAVYSVAFRLTGDASDAEDAAQDTFIRAYRALRSYDDARRDAVALRPWLATIAVNICRNRARAASRRPQVSGEVVDRATADRPTDDVVGDRETAQAMAAALQRLSEPQRRAIVLHHAAELTYPEVAAAVGRPVGTVKADVHRGLAALRTLLDPQEFNA